ncbi:MAG: phosphate ABC transporter permease PstA [Myxococcales bacterium]|nr:phosphate ABC transporter permease PstA [Myxococcales bacterium]MCB9749796.1 phosphate ABC transporter permease PstA [Myxococcales bacterium]
MAGLDPGQAKPPSRALERAFAGLCLAAALLPLLLLFVLLADVVYDGLSRLDWAFLTSYPSRRPERAGVLAGLVGSFYLVGLTALIALPLGVGAAVYLEEYGGRGRLAQIIEVNISNLAGVPSIIYGLLGLELFARTLAMGRSLLAGALMMALLVMPIVILSTREALRTVPLGMREAGLALGATRWQVTRRIVLPMSLPGILTGAILAIARAIGEAAPLIVLGALTYVDFLPDGLRSAFTVLPIQIFNWIGRPQAGFKLNAAAGIVLLLLMLLLFNGLAIYLRNYFQRRTR